MKSDQPGRVSFRLYGDDPSVSVDLDDELFVRREVLDMTLGRGDEGLTKEVVLFVQKSYTADGRYAMHVLDRYEIQEMP